MRFKSKVKLISTNTIWHTNHTVKKKGCLVVEQIDRTYKSTL